MNVKNKLLAALLCASLTLGLLAVPAAAMADEIPAETVVETTVPDQEAPADEATEAPAVEETEAPAATEAPAVEETEAPAATQAPAVEETQAPAATEAPAAEETQAPEAEAALMSVPAGVSAQFFIRKDGRVAMENGSTSYAKSEYTDHGKLFGLVERQAAWSNYYGEIENGMIDGTKLGDAFDKVAERIYEVPSDEAIQKAVPGFDPETQEVVWYVVKQVKDNCKWHVDGVIYDKDAQYVLQYHANAEDESKVTGIPGFAMHAAGSQVPVAFGVQREGYRFLGWSQDPAAAGPEFDLGGTETITMDSDKHLYAVWQKTFTVTTKTDGHGVITGAGTYDAGTDASVTFSAKEGWHIASVTVDGEGWNQGEIDAAEGAISFPALDADHTVAVTTAKDTATVSIFHYYEHDGGYVADAFNTSGGNVLDCDSQTVTNKWVASFVRSADQTPGGRYVYTSYEVMVMPQGAQAWNEPIYQLDGALDLNGVKDVRIHLVYDPYYTVTTTADGNSHITGTQSYKNGANAAVTYAAVEGWHIASVTVDGVAWTADQIAQAGGAIQFPAIKADHTVAVTAEADPVAPPTPEKYTVTAVIDGNGTITGAGTYDKGADVTVTYAANTGYHIASVTVDGETWTQAQIDGAKGAISFPALDADHAVAVTTARDQSSNGNNGGDDDRDDRPSKPDKKPDPKPEVTPEITIPDVQPPQGDVPGGETVEIVDEQVPQGGAPEGEELVIEDQDTPLADVPDLTETTGGLVILDSDTPMGSLPQTGTLAAPVDNTRTLAAIALSASLCAAGLAVLLGRKKEDAES